MFDTSPDGIQELLSRGESRSVEFKRRLPPDKVVGRVFSAFANSDGGIVIIGVVPDGTPLGLTREEAGHAIRRLDEIAASILPSPFELGTRVIQGKRLVYASVEPAPDTFRPVATSTGTAYQRRLAKDVRVPTPRVTVSAPKEPRRPGGRIRVFVAMSFRDEEEPALADYFNAMRRSAQRAEKDTGLKINVVRIDLVEGDYEISQRLMAEIDKANIVIADFTLRPPNVYFEVGYARGQSRRIIQTARKDTHLEFDVRNWHTVFYRNATELEEKLLPELMKACTDR